MPSVKIPLKGLAPLIEKLGKGAPAAIRRGLISSGLAMVAEMQKRTADAEIFDRGTFRRSWKSAPTERGVRVDIDSGEVFADGRRTGSDAQAMLSDACIAVSLLLQRGMTIGEVAASFGELRAEGQANGSPASLLGRIAIAGAALEAGDGASEG